MNYPIFKVIVIEELDGSQSVKGVLDRTSQGKEKWIDDGYIGTLKNGAVIAFGRWFKEGEMWRFYFDPEEQEKITVYVGQELFAIDGYWGERAKITLDESIVWVKSNFKSEDTSDHEHCAICWAIISESENTEYFVGNERHPVCSECFHSYVQKHDLSFIPSA